jgi:hypothetical protein
MMNLTRFYLNILTVNPVDQYKITKAKRDYVQIHPECAICGCQKNLEVHHVIPVHVDLSLSTVFENFLTLCDSNNNGCHRWIGHFGDFKNRWNLNIREYAISSRLFLQKMQPKRQFIIPTDYLIMEYAKALKVTESFFLEQVYAFNK